MDFILAILTVVGAYLIGSINFAVIFTKAFNHTDIRDYGSGNAGATNVMRVSGVKAGALTFIADAIKGVVACLLGMFVFRAIFTGAQLETYGRFLCGFACMVGHCWPVFFQFRGGKAAATSVGIFAVCCPPAIILGLVGFAISFAINKMVSFGSLVATLIVVVVTIISAFCGFLGDINPYIISLIMLVCGFIVFYRHKENITRIMNHTEKKFTVKQEKTNG